MPDSLIETFRWVWPLLVALGMIVVTDRLRKPSLEIQYRDEPVSQDSRRWVHVFVYNRPRKLIARTPANECKGRVTYINLDSGERKGPVETKWASRPGPVNTELNAKWVPVGYLIDDSTLVESKTESIAPGAEPKGLDIAVKFDGETDAWIWTPWSYYGHKKPEYRLMEGTYRVKVRIESPGISPVEDEFILVNKGDKAAGLRLMPASENSSGMDPR